MPYPYPYAARPGEVDEIPFVSLAELEDRRSHPLETHGAHGIEHEVHRCEVGGARVFGATASVLRQLLDTWRKA